MSGETKKVLHSTLWLGTAGAVLILGGIIALLASNWVRIPFILQIVIAFAPLIYGWAGFAYMLRHKTQSLAYHEILGIVWSGGVICSIALLGRILQLSSSAFLFCASVTFLLLPIALTLRSTAAWISTLGFAIASAIARVDGYNVELSDCILALAILLSICGILYARMRFAWQEESPYALGQRCLAAVGTIAATIALAFVLVELLDELPFRDTLPRFGLAVNLTFTLPLIFGTLLEQGCPPLKRPLSELGAIAFCFTTLVFLVLIGEESGKYDTLPLLIGIPLLVVVVGQLMFFHTLLLQYEGIFLLLLPISILAAMFGLELISLTLAIGVGAVVISVGVRTGQRMLANEGLLFTCAAAFVLFIQTDMSLTLQGFFLVLSGLAMIALNCVLTHLNKKGASHAS